MVATPYMDEAALCDRIALIQDAKILKIDSPQEIIKQYPKKIYNISADNIYKLLIALKEFEHLYSVYPFGEFVHYSDKRYQLDIAELILFLKNKGLDNIRIELAETTIEDMFMELAK